MTTVIKKMLDYAARPLFEFNKYETIDILETLQNTSRENQDDKREFYRLVYQTARGKVDLPKEHFRALVLRPLGDRDRTKVYEAVAKVEKAMGSRSPWSGSSHRGRSSNIPYRFLLAIFWSWEKDDSFDSLIYNGDICAGTIQWVDIKGNPVSVSREWTGNGRLGQRACIVEMGEVIGHVNELRFRDPDHFGSKIHPMYIIRLAS